MTEWVGTNVKNKDKEKQKLSREDILGMKCEELKKELKNRQVNAQKMNKEKMQNTLLNQMGENMVLICISFCWMFLM